MTPKSGTGCCFRSPWLWWVACHFLCARLLRALDRSWLEFCDTMLWFSFNHLPKNCPGLLYANSESSQYVVYGRDNSDFPGARSCGHRFYVPQHLTHLYPQRSIHQYQDISPRRLKQGSTLKMARPRATQPQPHRTLWTLPPWTE